MLMRVNAVLTNLVRRIRAFVESINPSTLKALPIVGGLGVSAIFLQLPQDPELQLARKALLSLALFLFGCSGLVGLLQGETGYVRGMPKLFLNWLILVGAWLYAVITAMMY